MEHIIEAYDLLVDQLKKELKQKNIDEDNEMNKTTTIIGILTKQLVNCSGKDAAMEVALLIDAEYKKEGFAEWVNSSFTNKGKKS
jgi:hypothetical protein